jgi:uncharacterized protein (DUF433 family)
MLPTPVLGNPKARLVVKEDVAMRFERITMRPGQMGGQPCIRGLRIPVSTVVDMVADGMSTEEIVAALPDLEPADVAEALHYAAATLHERLIPLLDPV